MIPRRVLSFGDLSGGYGDTVVVRNINGSVGPGQVLGVLGRNGVGKSTLLRLLMGYLKPISGRITLGDQDLGGLSTHARCRTGVSYAPQEAMVFDQLSVRDNLTLHRDSNALDDYEEMFAAFPRLRERLSQPAGSLSGGEKKILSFARALTELACVTLLDEPSEGVQQENIDRMVALIHARCAQGGSFVLVEQNLGFLLSAMHMVLVMDHGEVVLEGRARDFNRHSLEKHLHV